MKRFALIASAGALFAWGLSGALTGCGSDDAAVIGDGDGGEGGASSSSGGSSSGGTSSSGGSSGSPSDGGNDGGDGGDTDGGGGDGGASNPNKITCGATECTAPTQICCRTFGDAGCIAAADNCQGLEIECDEKADCPGGQLCCGTLGGERECDNACNGNDYQVCKTNTECGDGGTCKEWSCPPNNLKIRACEQPYMGCQ